MICRGRARPRRWPRRAHRSRTPPSPDGPHRGSRYVTDVDQAQSDGTDQEGRYPDRRGIALWNFIRLAGQTIDVLLEDGRMAHLHPSRSCTAMCPGTVDRLVPVGGRRRLQRSAVHSAPYPFRDRSTPELRGHTVGPEEGTVEGEPLESGFGEWADEALGEVAKRSASRASAPSTTSCAGPHRRGRIGVVGRAGIADLVESCERRDVATRHPGCFTGRSRERRSRRRSWGRQ
jgi:hypothetical protein